jgi:O-antigen ligase
VLEDTSEYEALDTVARATGPTSHAAVYGINLVMTIPFLFYFMRETRSRWGRIAILSALALVLYNVLLANTRAAILLSALVILLCGVRGLYRVTLGGVVAAAIAILAVMPFVPDAVYERVLDPANYSYERSGTLRIRLEYWQAGLRVAQDHWLSGVGVGNQNVIPRYLTSDGPVATTVHNDYLMTFMEVGLFGWLVFFGFVAIVTWAAFAAARHARARDGPSSRYRFLVACQITLVTVLIYGLQVDVFHFPLKGWWLIAGISWSLWRSVRDERPASVAPNVNAAEA